MYFETSLTGKLQKGQLGYKWSMIYEYSPYAWIVSFQKTRLLNLRLELGGFNKILSEYELQNHHIIIVIEMKETKIEPLTYAWTDLME